MTILLIDVGNSRLKWASIDEHESAPLPLSTNKEINQEAISYDKNSPIECFADVIEAKSNNNTTRVVIASVQGNKFAEQAEKITLKAGLGFFEVTAKCQMGSFKNAYKNPEQLGVDRFVAMLAAHEITSATTADKPKSCIVIDCGTAVTIDAIDASGQHLGGLILPGLQVCSNSLLKNTQQLFIEQYSNQQTFDLLTDNTSDAIISGSYYGLSGAIKETCYKIEKQHFQSQEVVKIICGGDAERLYPQLPTDFLIHTDLVMQGLKWIAKQTFKNNTK